MRASERAYQALRADILGWRLSPGEALSEVELAERLGVSRTPVREAISRLRGDGLATARPGRGVVVSEVSAQTVREMFEVRVALDCQAAALAAGRGSRAAFEDLARRLEEEARKLAEQDEDRASYYELVARMDEEIDEAAGNAYLLQAQQQLRTHLARVRRLSQGNVRRLREAAAEHAGIARAIARGDVDLAQATTRVHLAHALEAVLETVQHHAPPIPRDRSAPATATAPPPALATMHAPATDALPSVHPLDPHKIPQELP